MAQPSTHGVRPSRARGPAASGRGRAAGSREAVRARTRERLLDGALEALARHGLGKASMSDVSACARVSRGTAYRYFPDLDALLTEVVRREADRFERQVWDAMASAPEGEQRLEVALDFAARMAREHPVLQRLPETDPAFVLATLRERFPGIRESFGRLFSALLADTELVRQGLLGADQLVDWLTRLMVSTFLFPDERPEDTAAGLRAVYRLLASPARGTPPRD